MMPTIGVIMLHASSHVQRPGISGDWRIEQLAAGKSRRILSQLKTDAEGLDAVAIIGFDAKKTEYARKALSLRKHVLVDFPAAQTLGEISELRKLASESHLCLYSPNLLKYEPGVRELKTMAEPPSRMLSITISSSLVGAGKGVEHSMKLAQIINFIEWMAGSECVEIRGEKSAGALRPTAHVALMSHQNGIKTLMNLLFVSARSAPRFWLDVIFDKSVAHLDLYAQSIRVEPFGRVAPRFIDWAVSPLDRALKGFRMNIDSGAEEADTTNFQHVVELVRAVR